MISKEQRTVPCFVVWKLLNKAGKRIASLGADGSVLAD